MTAAHDTNISGTDISLINLGLDHKLADPGGCEEVSRKLFLVTIVPTQTVFSLFLYYTG